MSSFAGKKVLVVNTASYCGYTYQYADLQSLYTTYGGSGNPYNFEIIGFPSNDFANQEPYPEDSIIEVCQSYGVTFTMMSKVVVTGTTRHPVYNWLTKLSENCVQNANVLWNFQKYMVNPDGSWYGYKSSATSPFHADIVNWITAPTQITEADPLKETFYAYTDDDQTLKVVFTSKINSEVTVRMLTLTGQSVAVVYKGIPASGEILSFDYTGMAQGIYIVAVSSEEESVVKKISLL
jgi:glutathione peroxidase